MLSERDIARPAPVARGASVAHVLSLTALRWATSPLLDIHPLFPTMTYVVSNALPVLERTPAVFRTLLAGLPDDWTTCDEGPETFSPFENVGHLVQGERADWIPRARVILEQGANRRFQPYDRFAQRRESAGKSLEDLLTEFETLRARNVATLRGWALTDEQLSLQGEHPTFGPVTLRQLLATWVAHDLGHIAQTSRVMAKRYREAVGPWRAFLPVLDRGGPTG